MSTEGSTRAVVAALLANTGIAVTKFLAFLLTGASSMLAEAIHSLADAGNQVLLLVGSQRAKRSADETVRGLDSMNMEQLREVAEEEEIDYTECRTVEDFRKAIRAALAPAKK